MALPGSSDDCPVQITDPAYRPSGQGQLEQWLAKEAEGGIKPEDNDATSTTNYSDLYDSPKGREGGSSTNAHWGEEPHKDRGKQSPFDQNDATYAASRRESREVSGRAFQTLPAASSADQKLLAQNLEHARTGNFTTHSVLLQPKTKEGSASLSERVRHVVGRF